MLHLLAAPFLLICQLVTLPGLAAAAREEGEPKNSTIGVVDLDQVSKEVGWADDIDDDRKAAQMQANSAFAAYVESVKKAWESRRSAIGAAAHLNADELKIINATAINGDEFKKLPLSKDQRDDFLRCANEAAKALNSARLQMQEGLTKREARVIDAYRAAAKPSVQRVSASGGIKVVLPSNVPFFYDASVDISEQVVEDLRKQMPRVAMPAMPKVNFPEFRFSSAATPPDQGTE